MSLFRRRGGTIRSYYMGRFAVPEWLFHTAPQWAHEAADWLGGVEPSPWLPVRARVRRTLTPWRRR